MSNIHAQRLAALRQAMKEQKIDVWIAAALGSRASMARLARWP